MLFIMLWCSVQRCGQTSMTCPVYLLWLDLIFLLGVTTIISLIKCVYTPSAIMTSLVKRWTRDYEHYYQLCASKEYRQWGVSPSFGSEEPKIVSHHATRDYEHYYQLCASKEYRQWGVSPSFGSEEPKRVSHHASDGGKATSLDASPIYTSGGLILKEHAKERSDSKTTKMGCELRILLSALSPTFFHSVAFLQVSDLDAMCMLISGCTMVVAFSSLARIWGGRFVKSFPVCGFFFLSVLQWRSACTHQFHFF